MFFLKLERLQFDVQLNNQDFFPRVIVEIKYHPLQQRFGKNDQEKVKLANLFYFLLQLLIHLNGCLQKNFHQPKYVLQAICLFLKLIQAFYQNPIYLDPVEWLKAL